MRFRIIRKTVMKNYRIIAILIFTALIAAILSGCSDPTEYDRLYNEGYTVTVTYDSNGGEFIGSKNYSLQDMFNPDNYQKDGNGIAHIKLMEPTDERRPSGGSDHVTLIKTGYFFAGWYKERTLKTNESGEVVDWDGKVLTENYGSYYIKDAETETLGYPACVSYSGYWDFTSDTIDVGDDKEISLTLYAGWVPYYEFDYYYESNGEWIKYGETTFDYKTANKEGSTAFDRDTVFLPKYTDGAMTYVSKYADGMSYTFPSREGYTFNSAYLDEGCQNKITDSLVHQGSLNIETGTAVNRVQNVYVKFDEGEIYKIETAKQLADNANVNGIYYIESDLDFSEEKWPAVFMYNDFNGKIYGNDHVIKNVTATFTSTSAKKGGLFGGVSSGATLSGLTFENVTVDYKVTGYITECDFGLMSGNIESGANVSVTLKGDLTMKFGNVSLNTFDGGDHIAIYQIANILAGITCKSDKVVVTVYGEEQFGTDPKEYKYTVNNDSVKCENGRITFQVEAGLENSDKAEYTYNYSIGG